MADQKSTNILIARLFGKKPDEQGEKNTDKAEKCKNKVKSPKRVVRKPSPKKSFIPQSNKITNWCSKEKLLKDLENNRETLKNLKKKPMSKSLEDDFKKSSKSKSQEDDFEKPKSKKKPIKLTRTDSFEKYGVLMPTLDDILEDKKKLDTQKQKLQEARQIEDISLDLTFSLNKSADNEVGKENILGCKHLTNPELTDLFNKNKCYLSEIISGEKYSERHSRFHNYNVKYDLTTKDLTYNTSMIVFSHDQIEHMMNLLSENFDPDDKLTQYFFKVLLPEFCTKVFMDVHNMSQEETLMYLETRPLDD
ncbi:unnamed protein product [Brassicogethes aeneus]|uniref:Uncharacterized protein n=1 Tax=Brassicogethes aeneus TaxID=1431903 RepID=A0A9P0FK99_BRAAE|nr:unnamed protein product [Brassicogethes aeneus]